MFTQCKEHNKHFPSGITSKYPTGHDGVHYVKSYILKIFVVMPETNAVG